MRYGIIRNKGEIITHFSFDNFIFVIQLVHYTERFWQMRKDGWEKLENKIYEIVKIPDGTPEEVYPLNCESYSIAKIEAGEYDNLPKDSFLFNSIGKDIELYKAAIQKFKKLKAFL